MMEIEALDGIFIGPMDLSASMGIRGQFDNKEFKAAIKRIENIVIPSGKFLGTVANDIEDAQSLYDKGYNIVYMMSDAVDLSRMAEGWSSNLRSIIRRREKWMINAPSLANCGLFTMAEEMDGMIRGE